MAVASSPDRRATRPDIDDCWNRIGVRGDSSCERLAEHIQCRNCPVYARAALALLDRKPPTGYLAEWTRHFAQLDSIGDDQADRSESGSVIVFRAGAEWLALSTISFQEIADPRPIHSLPRRRGGAVLGIVNVRGELLICISVTRLLGLDEAPPLPGEHSAATRQRLLVTGRRGRRVAMPVDEVHGVQRFQANALGEIPATLAGSVAHFTRGMLAWQDRTVGCLDEDVFFDAIDRSLA